MPYAIERNIPGGFRDYLLHLWEGDGLPSFRGSGPYLFDDKQEANRVMWRLQTRYSKTFETPEFPALPITYCVVPVAQKRIHQWPGLAITIPQRRYTLPTYQTRDMPKPLRISRSDCAKLIIALRKAHA